jgi:hypothetical protein
MVLFQELIGLKCNDICSYILMGPLHVMLLGCRNLRDINILDVNFLQYLLGDIADQ